MKHAVRTLRVVSKANYPPGAPHFAKASSDRQAACTVYKENMKKFIIAFSLLFLAACNSVYIKPGTMEPGSKVYATRGGFTMARDIKEKLEEHGFTVTVGKLKDEYSIDVDKFEMPRGTKYIVRVKEYKESFLPWWCVFNGFRWWKFSVSIADQKNGEEILSWRGRGCQNSSLRKLDRFLDELEIKE